MSQAIRVHAALITVSLIYGYFYVAVKMLMVHDHLGPAEFILLRFLLTAAIVAIIERLFFKTRFESKGDFLKVAGLGLLGVFLVQILVVWGLSLTTAFHSALIMATIPVTTSMISILLGRETFHPQKLAGIFIAFAGVAVLLFFSKNPQTPLPETYVQGDLIVLLNAVAFSWFLIGSHSMLKKYNSFSFMAYCYIVSGLAFAAIFLGFNADAPGGPLGFVSGLQPAAWVMMLYVVLFASIGTYTLNNYALSRVNPSIVAVYIFIQPIISAISGNRLLGEPFNAEMAAATFITFIGVLLTSMANHKGIYLRNQPEPALSAPEEDEEEKKASIR